MKDYHVPLEAGKCYHIFSHAVGSELLFPEPRNFPYFLDKFRQYLGPISDMYAYSLIPNHFHVCLKFKDAETLELWFKNEKGKTEEECKNLPKLILRQVTNFLISYAKSINKAFGRMGSLFTNKIRRVLVEDAGQFKNVIRYIHLNPVNHGLVKDIKAWYWSSWSYYINRDNYWIKIDRVFECFGGEDVFFAFHQTSDVLKTSDV